MITLIYRSHANVVAMRIRYANEHKLRIQMARRGWTERQIVEALQTQGIAVHGKRGPATRYVHPGTGRSVVVDDATGEVFHVGGDGFEYHD
jgi:hypothetical protein